VKEGKRAREGERRDIERVRKRERETERYGDIDEGERKVVLCL
jgi:hypothetical protein